MTTSSAIKVIRLADFATPGRDGKKRFEWNTVGNFLKSSMYQALRELGEQSLQFSLDGFDFINSDGLIWLLLLGDQFKLKQNSLWLQLPTDQSQLRSLKSCGFHTVALDTFSIINIYLLDEVSSIDLMAGLKFIKVTLSVLTSQMKGLDALFRDPSFLHQLGVVPTGQTAMQFLSPFLRTIQETTKNIVQHSGTRRDEGHGYFVVERLGTARVRICVADAGCGYSSSLRSKGIRTTNDFEAIRKALLFRYMIEGGEGLFRVVQFVSRLGGVVRIHSGDGEGFLQLPQRLLNDENTKSLIADNLKRVRSQFYFPGVQLQIDLQAS